MVRKPAADEVSETDSCNVKPYLWSYPQEIGTKEPYGWIQARRAYLAYLAYEAESRLLAFLERDTKIRKRLVVSRGYKSFWSARIVGNPSGVIKRALY